MYTKKRPVIVSGNMFPNAYIVILTNASTKDELMRDIASNSDIQHSTLQSLAFNTDSYGRITSEVPLFERGANITSEYDQNFENVVEAFKSNPNDERILCVNLTESTKNFASGSNRPVIQPLSTIDSCIKAIEERGLVSTFKDSFGYPPEEASLSELQGFLCNEHIRIVQEQAKAKEPSLAEALQCLIAENQKLARMNQNLTNQVSALSSKVDMLADRYDDDDDDDNEYPDRMNVPGITRR